METICNKIIKIQFQFTILVCMLFSIVNIHAQIFLSSDVQITGKEHIYSKNSITSITNKVEVEVYVAKNSTFIIKEGTKVSGFFLTEDPNNESITLVAKNEVGKNSNPASSTSKKKLVKREVKATQFEESNSSLVLLNINGKGSVVVPISNYIDKAVLKNINELFVFVKIGHKETDFSFLINYRTSSFYNRYTSRPPPANFS